MRLGASALAALLFAAAMPARADDLIERLVAFARQPAHSHVAFTRTVVTESGSGAKAERRVAVERFDPSHPYGAQWTLLSVNGAPPTPKEQRSFRKERDAAPLPNYARIAVYLAQGCARGVNAQGRTVCRIEKLPAGSFVIAGSDISSSLSGEAVIDDSGPTPFVEDMRISARTPVRIKLLAKLEKLAAVTRYRLEAGRLVLVRQDSSISGSMFLKSGTIRTLINYANASAD